MCKGESDPSKVVDDVVARVAFAKKILSVVSRQWSSAIMLPATSSRQMAALRTQIHQKPFSDHTYEAPCRKRTIYAGPATQKIKILAHWVDSHII